jgi:hypothetical protein
MERILESKYLKPSREGKTFSNLCVAFFITLIVLPQYFGVPIPIFDFTVLRIMMILMLIGILRSKDRQRQFVELISKESFSKVLIPYLLVLTYTLVLRVDLNALLNPLLEITILYLLVYVIRYYFGIQKTFRYIVIFAYLMVILGLIEFAIQRSPFSYLETISGLYTGRFIRSGSYRVMGSANHSLGYGLMLITIVPVICYDIQQEEINILKNKLLIFLIAVNVFLCGSRSTLGVFFIEIALLVLCSKKIMIKRYIIIGSALAVIFVCLLIALRNTSIGQYILLQFTSILDEIFDTTYSIKYGANVSALGASSNYRDQLKYIFGVEGLNPILGIGRNRSFSYEINGSYIRSVDNFYIAEYIRYAYPGLISYVLFLLYFIVGMVKYSIQHKSQISNMLLIGVVCYCINLIWVDSLQTLKYLYVLFAIFSCLPYNFQGMYHKCKRKDQVFSKYIKK